MWDPYFLSRERLYSGYSFCSTSKIWERYTEWEEECEDLFASALGQRDKESKGPEVLLFPIERDQPFRYE